MAKEITAKVKLQCPGGQATPAPPVGPALGGAGVPIGEFIKQFNEATRNQMGMIIPVIVTVFKDRSFKLEFKTPPASVLLKKAAGVEKGAKTAGTELVGKVNSQQVREIAEIKMKDLNAASVETAMRMVEGTARSMGIRVEG